MSLERRALQEKFVIGFADLVIGLAAGSIAEDLRTSLMTDQPEFGYLHAEGFPLTALTPFIYNRLRDTRFAQYLQLQSPGMKDFCGSTVWNRVDRSVGLGVGYIIGAMAMNVAKEYAKLHH